MRRRRRDSVVWERRHREFEQRCFAAFLPAMKAVGLDPGVEGSTPGVSGTPWHVGEFAVLLYEGDIDTGETPVNDYSGEVWLEYNENTGSVHVSLLGDLRHLEGWAANEDGAFELFAEGLRPLFERESTRAPGQPRRDR